MTQMITGPRIVVPEGAPRTVWMLERGEGVTASEAWEIARGGIKTWRRILEQKMNGATFRGNRATDAGHAREDALLDDARDHLVTAEPNGALWAAADNDLHRATPDGLGRNTFGEVVVIEVKSHEHGYKGDGIPADHMAQMQFQMHVLGAASALYGSEIRDEDDQPPADGATWTRVPRDEEMIAYLVDRANAFLAWRDAGCPDFDDLPEEVAVALRGWTMVKPLADAAGRDEKRANDALKKVLATQPHAARFGAVGMSPRGGYQLLVTETVSIDEDEWKADAPEVHAWVQQMRVDLALLEAAAKRTYPKITRRASLRFQEVDADV